MGKQKQVTILGAGPAGIAAAIYLKRTGLTPIILEKQRPGGLLRHAFLVENYPGFPHGISGTKLADMFVLHLHKLGLSVTKSDVNCVEHKNDAFIVRTEKGEFVSSAIIIASGTTPKKIQFPGTDTLEGKRIFYEPRAIPFRTKKRIIVIGGGDIAFDYTLTLLEKGNDVTILSRSKPVCLPLLKKRVKQQGARLQTSCVPEKIRIHRKSLLLHYRQHDSIIELPADYLLIACGREPNLSFLSPSLTKHTTENKTFSQMSLPGLYFAGDVIRGTCRQTGIAVGDGIYAAMMVHRYIKEKEGAS